jgi:hypothetical protein
VGDRNLPFSFPSSFSLRFSWPSSDVFLLKRPATGSEMGSPDAMMLEDHDIEGRRLGLKDAEM